MIQNAFLVLPFNDSSPNVKKKNKEEKIQIFNWDTYRHFQHDLEIIFFFKILNLIFKIWYIMQNNALGSKLPDL